MRRWPTVAVSLDGNATNVTKAGKQALHDWLNEGGKVFATHFHYTWFQNGPADFQDVANWKGWSLGTGTCNDCPIDQTFRAARISTCGSRPPALSPARAST